MLAFSQSPPKNCYFLKDYKLAQLEVLTLIRTYIMAKYVS